MTEKMIFPHSSFAVQLARYIKVKDDEEWKVRLGWELERKGSYSRQRLWHPPVMWGPCCIRVPCPQKKILAALPVLCFWRWASVPCSLFRGPGSLSSAESHRTEYGSRRPLKKRRTGANPRLQEHPRSWKGWEYRQPPMLKIFQLYNGTEVCHWTPSCTFFLLSGIKPQLPVSHETMR